MTKDFQNFKTILSFNNKTKLFKFILSLKNIFKGYLSKLQVGNPEMISQFYKS